MKKILVIEDDEKIALALAVRLRAKGYQVLTAADALAGTTLAFKHQPDLIILDIAMPAGDGFDVAEKIQGRATTVGTPIIFITAGRLAAWKEKAEALGAAAYIEKPFRASHLLATIERLLERAPKPEAPACLAPNQPILTGRW